MEIDLDDPGAEDCPEDNGKQQCVEPGCEGREVCSGVLEINFMSDLI